LRILAATPTFRPEKKTWKSGRGNARACGNGDKKKVFLKKDVTADMYLFVRCGECPFLQRDKRDGSNKQ